MLVPVNVVEVTPRGKVSINLAADEMNADWIRAARLKQKGHINKLKQMEKNKGYQAIIEEI